MGYQIPFKSLHDTDYLLLINGGGTAIDGAAQTFVTSEDADTDFFKPVRTQSGTFSFLLASRAVWEAMVPANALSIPVQLTTGGVVKWQGYIQPQVYHHDYPDAGAQAEHEFSVQCPLSVLDTIDFVDVSQITNIPPVFTIGQLLEDYVFGKLTGTTIDNYYLQGLGEATATRLNLKVMLQNFIETDSTGNIRNKYTCMQVLEDVCRIFGYTCRIHGTDIYFTMPITKTGRVDVGFSKYTTLKNVSAGSYSQRGTLAIANQMLCNTNSHEEILPGIGTVTVTSDINKLDNLIEIPYDELFDKYNLGNSSTIVRPVDYYEHEVYNLIRVPDGNNASMAYENDTVSLAVHMDNKPGIGYGGGVGKIYCRFFVYDDQDVGDVGGGVPKSKENYSWRKCIELFHSYAGTNPNGAMFTIASKQAFVISDGILYINFKCHQVSAWISAETVPEGCPRAKCSLKIGGRWWNGTEWTETESSDNYFLLPFTSEGAKTNRTSIDDPQYQGFGIPVNSSVIPTSLNSGVYTLRGEIEFKILDVECFKANEGGIIPSFKDISGFLPLMDFEIGFVRGVIEDTKQQGNEYVVRGGDFREEYSVHTIFACDVVYGPQAYQRHMAAGVGYLLDGQTEKPAATIPSVDALSVIAEQELAQVIAQYGGHTHRLVALDLWTDLLGDALPTDMSSTDQEDPIDGIGNMFPLAISHNWRDDITTLTLIAL